MDCYALLTDRAKHIGYTVSKVVYRGYVASTALQATHDNAVSTRMSLKLDAESEKQEQALKEFRLKREKERIKLSMYYTSNNYFFLGAFCVVQHMERERENNNKNTCANIEIV